MRTGSARAARAAGEPRSWIGARVGAAADGGAWRLPGDASRGTRRHPRGPAVSRRPRGGSRCGGLMNGVMPEDFAGAVCCLLLVATGHDCKASSVSGPDPGLSARVLPAPHTATTAWMQPSRGHHWQRHRHPLLRGIGGLLLPGAPRTALIAYAATASASLSLALVERPDDGGTMPSEKSVFTTRVEPVSPPQRPAGPSRKTGGGAGHCPRVHYAYSTNRLSP